MQLDACWAVKPTSYIRLANGLHGLKSLPKMVGINGGFLKWGYPKMDGL